MGYTGARDVYEHSRQFDFVDDLKEAILASWERIPMASLHSLVDSMQRRALELFERGDRETSY